VYKRQILMFPTEVLKIGRFLPEHPLSLITGIPIKPEVDRRLTDLKPVF
jgi:hypothetical protein